MFISDLCGLSNFFILLLLGKILWRRPSPNQNGIHIRQRSNPEQGRLAHELMMRSRVDPASSVGDLPANFPALGARRSSRSPRESDIL